jgi:hypothetical protein
VGCVDFQQPVGATHIKCGQGYTVLGQSVDEASESLAEAAKHGCRNKLQQKIDALFTVSA